MNRAQRLGLYSIQTSAFLSGNLAAGQVVYTDIDPDIVLDTDGAYCGVDVNQDGVDDFGFLNFEFAVYSDSRSSTQLVQELLVGPLPLSISNKIAGQFAIVGGFTGTIYFEIPYALKWNVTIGSELSWQEDNIQQLAAYVGYEDGGGVFLNCHWANEHNHNNLEAYIGIQFHDQNNLLHY
jgi:hypothetical protein